MIEQGALTIRGSFQLLEEISEQRHMERVDLGNLGELLGIAAVVSERMMRIGNANLGISSRTRFASQLECDHSRNVALQREHLKVEHQARMIRVRRRYSNRAIEIGQ